MKGRRRFVAGGLFVLAVLAGGVMFAQVPTAECNWASPIGSFDSSHGFTKGTGPSGWLFAGCTILLTAAATVAIPPGWVRYIAFLPLGLVSLLIVFLLSGTPNNCRSGAEPPVKVICKGDDWKTLDRGPGEGRFHSRQECLDSFYSLHWR